MALVCERKSVLKSLPGLLASLAVVAWTAAPPAWAQSPVVVHHIGPLTGVLAASN